MAVPIAQMQNVTCKKGGFRQKRHTFRGTNQSLWGNTSARPSAGRKGYWYRRLPSTLRGPLPCFAQVGLFFSTSTGHTEDVAGLIKTEFGNEASEPEDIGDIELSKLTEFDSLIVGLDLSSKKVAVFGLGDSLSYSDYFCDAMEEIYTLFKGTGATMVGHWPAEGYQHEDSKALVEDGAKFVGLALDEDNEDDQSLPRIKQWVEQLKSEGIGA